MTPEKILEDQIIMTIKTVEDPEIPVNIYELGLIYFININKFPQRPFNYIYTIF